MAKKEETNVDEIVMDRMPGADAITEEDTKPFEVDLNFEDEPQDEPQEEEVNEEVSEETNSLPEEEVVEEDDAWNLIFFHYELKENNLISEVPNTCPDSSRVVLRVT